MTLSKSEKTVTTIEPGPQLLEVDSLKVRFIGGERPVSSVDGVSFSIFEGETVGLAGESGCGKSVTAYSILRLLAEPPAVVSGKITFDGQSLLELDERALASIRGNRASIIFQDPISS